jgi:hypothetical protein
LDNIFYTDWEWPDKEMFLEEVIWLSKTMLDNNIGKNLDSSFGILKLALRELDRANEISDLPHWPGVGL